MTGGAKLVASAHAHAHGGICIGELGGSPSSTAEFTVQVPSSGRHVLVVHYAHDDRRDNGHAYNTDIMSRTADIAIGRAAPRRVTFKNTWSVNDFWTLGVPVDLERGANTVTFANANSWAPNIGRVEVARVVGQS